ncbi:MAG: hypothetical protein Kilf2KO_07650 [Rhodospirillales bacterium]
MADRAGRGKLKARELVGDSYRLWFRNWTLWLVALALPAAIDVVVRATFQQTYMPRLQGSQDVYSTVTEGQFLLRSFAMLVTSVITSTLFAVSWHRLSLLGAKTRLFPTIGPQHMRFALVSLVLIAITVAIVRLGGLLAQTGGTTGLVVLLSLVLSCILYLRWSMAFPAAAIGAPSGFVASWRLTRGAAFKLFWAIVLGLIPVVVASLVIGSFAQRLLIGLGGPPLWSELLVEAVLSYWLLAILIGVVSAAYRRLTADSGGGRPFHGT